LVEGTPTGLIEAHVGSSIIEINGADQELRQFLGERVIGFDEMGERLVIYNNGNAEIEQAIRSAFHSRQCTFRSASLEDVFLRLTGRELRE